MCGIAGYVSAPEQALDVNVLAEVKAALHHRGPDDAGIFQDSVQGVCLVHTRLSILDLSSLGHQPMCSNDGRVTIVFNGEIYNYQELRSELQAEGHKFKSHSDTEVLLQLYLACRDSNADLSAALCRLNGIFAFALWDSECGSLLLARDALGVKPLYYYMVDGQFSFASEIKGLLPLAPSLGSLDAAALGRYLSFLWCPGDGTPVQNIKKLGAGEFMWVREGVIEERVIWYRLPAFRSIGCDLRESNAVSGTVKHLRAAVHRQLVADVPVGAFLSGGLDSSSVVAFARELNPDIRCFTIETTGGAENGTVDDLPYARRVAEHLGVPLEVVSIDAKRMANDIEGMVAQLDEPLADPAPLNVLYISRLAREQGVKVLLSGAGGDDLFTGYRRHRALMVEQWWSWWPRLAREALAHVSSSLDHRSLLGRRIAKLFSGAGLDGDARLVNYFRWTRRADLEALFSEDFRAALLDDKEIDMPMLTFLQNLPEHTSRLERMLALEQRFFLTDHNLLYTDKMSMAAGVEVRVPFLDKELVEFAGSIPARLKQRGKEGKWVLKKAMEPYLPNEVIYRAKTGFGAPLRRWMRHELRELLGDLLSEASLKHRGVFDPAAVQRLIVDNDSGRVDASYTLLSLLCIEIWCRTYLESR